MPLGFEHLDNDSGLFVLNGFLSDKSYIVGFTPSKADTEVFAALKKAPSDAFPHAARWYKQIASYSAAEKSAFVSRPGSASSPAKATPKSPKKESKPAPKAADEDDIDLFGSDDDDAEAEKLKQQRLAEYKKKKEAKPAVIAKSSIVLDVKPWDDETDMKLMEAGVRAIKMDGLLWGASKLIPIGYGIKKLQIGCVVEDAKVSTDELEEQITALEDYVQSMDIAAFQKI